MFSTAVSGSARRLKEMTTDRIAATLADDPRLILPIGTCGQYAHTLPAGCTTMIAERLADDLSAEFGVLRAPTFEYGVNPEAPPGTLGAISLHKKTLHRTLNDMLASWETHGVTEFILLTAHGYDPYLEALSTVSTVSARVRIVDVFAVHFAELLDYPRGDDDDRSLVYLALLRYIAPTLTTTADAPEASAERGQAVYEYIRARVSERIFLAPVPTE
jgi:hypothetical protein